MGLLDTPPTRNETYTTATPVNPNTMNALQDEVVARGAEHSIGYGVYSWQSLRTTQQGEWDAGGGQHWEVLDTQSKFTIPIDLPAGTVLTRVKFYYTRGSAGSDCNMGVRYGDITGGGIATQVNYTDTLQDGSVAALEVDLADILMAVDNAYHIFFQANSDNTGFSLYAAQLFYYPAP